MKDLSLNILDIAQNSIAAQASKIDIALTEQGGIRTLTIKDDGHGMSEEMVNRVTHPFTTTRTTRPIGMGIPLLKLAAEQTGGSFQIESKQGENHGTLVTATFSIDHIDCMPVGDLASTMVVLLQGSPDIDFTFRHETDKGRKWLCTREMREQLEGVALNTPEVLMWVREYIEEPLDA